MKILSVSDRECELLFSRLEKDRELGRSFDLILACGDLRDETVMRLADLTNKIVYYVDGNHFFYDAENRAMNEERFSSVTVDIPGGINTHLKVVCVGKVLLCGFSGSMRYKDGPGQYTEAEMGRNVNWLLIKLRWQRLKEKLFRKNPAPLIVMSHAPIQDLGDESDPPHRGFAAFRKFVLKAKPVLWIHGHIHLKDFKDLRVFRLDKTLVVNTYEFKTTTLGPSGVQTGFSL